MRNVYCSNEINAATLLYGLLTTSAPPEDRLMRMNSSVRKAGRMRSLCRSRIEARAPAQSLRVSRVGFSGFDISPELAGQC